MRGRKGRTKEEKEEPKEENGYVKEGKDQGKVRKPIQRQHHPYQSNPKVTSPLMAASEGDATSNDPIQR